MGGLSLWVSLAFLSREDGIYHAMKGRSLACYSIWGVCTAAARFTAAPQELSAADAIVLCFLLLLLWWKGKEKVGAGDIWVMAGLPLFLSGEVLWGALMAAFLVMGAAALLLWIRKKDKSAGIPFIPFLWIGLTIMLGRSFLYGWI